MKNHIISAILAIVVVCIADTAMAETRTHHLSKMGVSYNKIQSIQHIERQVLKDLKSFNTAALNYKRVRSQRSRIKAQRMRRRLTATAKVYSKALKAHLNHQQLASYMSHLNRSTEVIHILGGLYSPYVLTPLISL